MWSDVVTVFGQFGAFFEELWLHGTAKTSIEIEHFYTSILNFTIVGDEGPQSPQNLSEITGIDNGYKKGNDKYKLGNQYQEHNHVHPRSNV